MRHQAYLRGNLEVVSDFLGTIAFHMTLYLWSVFLMKIRPSCYIYILRAIVICSALLVIALSILCFISFSLIYVNSIIYIIQGLLQDISVLTQCLLAILSVMFGKRLLLLMTVVGIGFYWKKRSLSVAPSTVAALSRLSLLGFFGLFFYAALVVIKVLYIYGKECEPVILFAMVIIREFSLLTWFIALLFTFRIKTSNTK